MIINSLLNFQVHKSYELIQKDIYIQIGIDRHSLGMNNSTNQQNLFHKFILSADSLPNQANIFPYFQFMDLSIRKTFHQLKKTGLRKGKSLTAFQQIWSQLNSQQRVNLYCKWVGLLKKALQMQKNPQFKLQPTSVNIQDQIFIKTAKIFNKWDKRIAKLTSTHLLIISNRKTRQYELKDLQIRKSKSKQTFSWVLHNVRKAGRIIHCGASNQNSFNQWYYALICNIDNQRVQYFLKNIRLQKENPGSFKLKLQQNVIAPQNNREKGENLHNKTLTEIMISRQMKTIDRDDQFSDISSSDEKKMRQMKNQYHQKHQINQFETDSHIKENPNIFKRLIPEYKSLIGFSDTPVNCPLLHCNSQYRIYQLPTNQQNASNLKFFTVLPYPKSLIFNAITAQVRGWNDDVDVLTVKTNISSQNSVLYYEKTKQHGILYRQRDFLFLRHCFQVTNMKQNNTFIIDKSIDSIHQPPFMTVVRAQKQLIWGLIQKQKDKQCLMIVQGWIKGGGYMNLMQNRQMTMKFMKKLLNLNGFLKQLSFSQNSKGGLLFKQEWKVDIEKTQQIHRQTNVLHLKQSQSENSQNQKEVKQQQSAPQKQQQKRQLQEFIKRTTQQHFQDIKSQQFKSQVGLSDQKISTKEQYKPPNFTENGQVIIPGNHLSIRHIQQPKQKPKKPKYFPHFRGHHLWKGQWEVLNSGGLAYVDEEKMKEQKKVLTYIIKRIGRNIFSGKGILNISLPVDIFCVQSNIQRLAMSFGFFPSYLEKAATIQEPQLQLKYVMGGGIASSLIYLTMEKPFNPILGETFQCWIDECPIYFEQISHHPPIAAFMMYGRGYKTYGCVQAKMDLSINSGTGNNEGVFTIQFDNGNTVHFTTPAGCLMGLTYGERKLNLVGKSYYWNRDGLFTEVQYNPNAKNKGFFGGGGKGEGQEKLIDYFEGYVKKYDPSDIANIAFKEVNGKSIPIVPKSGPSAEAKKTFYKINGRWNKYLNCDGEKIWDVNQTRYFDITPQNNPLPSHSNYRQDIVYRRLKNFVKSQDYKQILEIKQRQDRKLRAKYGKINST